MFIHTHIPQKIHLSFIWMWYTCRGTDYSFTNFI